MENWKPDDTWTPLENGWHLKFCGKKDVGKSHALVCMKEGHNNENWKAHQAATWLEAYGGVKRNIDFVSKDISAGTAVPIEICKPIIEKVLREAV